MPVYKYKDISEMKERTWRDPGNADLFRAIAATWDFARRTTRPHFPPGVYKHRSLALAQKLRDSWEQRNFEAFRERRKRGLSRPASSLSVTAAEPGSGHSDTAEHHDRALAKPQ